MPRIHRCNVWFQPQSTVVRVLITTCMPLRGATPMPSKLWPVTR